MRLVLGSLACLFTAATVAALTYRGADFSSVLALEKSGLKYSDGGTTLNFEKILSNHGANTARIRIWTTNGDYGLNYGLQLAKRVKAAGQILIVDLHYSDSWADPGKQYIPSSWPTDLAGLNTKVYTYTKDIVSAFATQGTPIDILQVGNEVNDGLLWPTGRISVNGFSAASQLLRSGVNGARDASPGMKILIHIANGWNWGGVEWFFNGIFVQGALGYEHVDFMGFSIYPFYESGATLSALTTSLRNTVNKWNKDVFIAETDWPVSCSKTLTEPSIPKSAAGQQQWVQAVKNVLTGLPNGRGKGILYWEPGWVGNAGLGSSCADAILVDGSGKARTSINMFSANM